MLFEPIETDRRGEVPAGQKPFFSIPVFNWYRGLLSTLYHRNYIESARRFLDVQPLTPGQLEALDLFDQLANDPALHFQMEFLPGDIQLVHNHTMLHDRTAFLDWPEPEPETASAASLAGSGRSPAASNGIRGTIWLNRAWSTWRNHSSRNAIHDPVGSGGRPMNPVPPVAWDQPTA